MFVHRNGQIINWCGTQLNIPTFHLFTSNLRIYGHQISTLLTSTWISYFIDISRWGQWRQLQYICKFTIIAVVLLL